MGRAASAWRGVQLHALQFQTSDTGRNGPSINERSRVSVYRRRRFTWCPTQHTVQFLRGDRKRYYGRCHFSFLSAKIDIILSVPCWLHDIITSEFRTCDVVSCFPLTLWKRCLSTRPPWAAPQSGTSHAGASGGMQHLFCNVAFLRRCRLAAAAAEAEAQLPSITAFCDDGRKYRETSSIFAQFALLFSSLFARES